MASRDIPSATTMALVETDSCHATPKQGNTPRKRGHDCWRTSSDTSSRTLSYSHFSNCQSDQRERSDLPENTRERRGQQLLQPSSRTNTQKQQLSSTLIYLFLCVGTSRSGLQLVQLLRHNPVEEPLLGGLRVNHLRLEKQLALAVVLQLMPLALAHEAVGTLRHGVGVQCPAKGLFLWVLGARLGAVSPSPPVVVEEGRGTLPRVFDSWGLFLADAVSLSQRLLFFPMRTDDKRSPGGSNMRGAAGAMDAGGAGGGGSKRGDACLAEIQRLEKNRANRRNRMEKARLVVCVFSKGL